MLATSEAIVIALQPQTDKAHALHAYTREGGRVVYKVYGIGKKNTTGKYTPLSVLQLTTDKSAIRTAQLLYVPQSILSDVRKRAVALFISEVLYHVLRHPMPDEPMYAFIVSSITALDASTEPENFHIHFLLEFAAKLGFAMEQPPAIPQTRTERQNLLRDLCRYFAEHVETWREPRSLAILMEVFD